MKPLRCRFRHDWWLDVKVCKRCGLDGRPREHKTSHQENVDGSVSLVIEGSDHIQYPHIVEPWQ